MTTQAPDQQGDDVATDASSPSPQTDSSATVVDAPDSNVAGRRRPSTTSVFALALAFFAAAAAGFLWWQYRQFYVVLDRADGETDVSLREVRADLRSLEDRLAQLGEEREDLARVVQQVVDRVNSYPARFADLDEKLAVAQGVSADARGRWLRAQAEYYLSTANAELTLNSNRGSALEALELADQALLDAGSPAFAAVRERIAAELQELRALRVPDVEGLSFSLSGLAARVRELPMRIPTPDSDEATARRVNEAEPGLGRLWQSFKNALAGMFRIERREPTPVYSLSRNQQILVRRQVELELTLARLGLVQVMPELYAASIGSALSMLQEHFDTEQAGVEGAIALLEDMRALEVAPSYPDISGSLALLRSLPDREG
jgi:uroporphyrin-III C-methyltransferase